MKLLKIILSSIIVSCLASCGGGGSGGSSTSSTPSVPSSIPSGAIVSINPEIEFTSELTVSSPATAIYSNTDATYFPVSADESVTVNMESTSSTITISFKLASGKSIQLIISDLTDLGEDGYYDEYTVDAKVDGTTVLNTRGYFPGTKKPRNLGVSSPVDINRAPTEEEFNKYLVGQVFYHFETYPKQGEDSGYFVLNSDKTGTMYESETDTDVDDDKVTWSYDYNGGDPLLSVRWDESDGDYEIVVVKFIFTNFYEGTYEDLYEIENGTRIETLDRGYWKVFRDIPEGIVPAR